jgi:hypothetical protein
MASLTSRTTFKSCVPASRRGVNLPGNVTPRQ